MGRDILSLSDPKEVYVVGMSCKTLLLGNYAPVMSAQCHVASSERHGDYFCDFRVQESKRFGNWPHKGKTNDITPIRILA